MEVGDCALCKTHGPLEESHLIPKFVGRWLKKTSATGRLRVATNANVPVQDLTKKPFLCGACEDRFSKLETQFSNEVFLPYVEGELDGMGLKQFKSEGYSYDEWLLQFLMSIQWRYVAWGREELERLTPRHRKLLDRFEEAARSYLLGSQCHTGRSETHLLLFQSMMAVQGPIPAHVHENVNVYLLRATDGTLVWTASMLGILSKLGPIGVYTTLDPQRMVGMPDTRVRKKGVLPIEQRFLNQKLTQFLLTDRPRQIYQHYQVSEGQKKKINELAAKDIKRTENSLSYAAWLGDQYVRGRKGSSDDE